MIHDDNSSVDKYLVYDLGAEQFATPLIEVRAVIEYHAAKPIPHTVAFYKGVINIRGEIIGVLDLRERLQIKGSDHPTSQLIFETDVGPLAATVDRVISVAMIPESDISRQAATDETSATNRPYYLGVAKVNEQILTLISLRQVAAHQTLTRTGA